MNKFVLLFQPMHGPWDKLFCRVPESLLTIAAAPFKEGYDVKILDQRITPNWEKKLVHYIKKKPICVGITSLTGPSLKYALEAASIVKRTDNCVKVVFGGVHVTLLPEQSLQNDDIDIIVKGEGDYTFLKLIKALENKQSLDDIRGLYYKKDGKIVFTGEPEMILDMDSLPETPYELLDLNKYSAVDLGAGKSISFQTSRGCTYNCKFCLTVNIHNNKWRGISIDKIISKIKMLQEKYGYNTFLFLDDSTSLNPTHFRELLHALNNLEIKIIWTTIGIRADLIARLNIEDIKLIWESGCKALDIGIESGNERVLKYINKGETKETMLLANKKLSEYPIKTKYTFMIGYPTETKEEINDTINFYLKLSKENPNAYPMIFIYAPIFGTPLYSEALQNHFEQPKTMNEWANLDYNSWFYKYPNWNSKKERRKMEVVNISSFFCNANAKFKLTKRSSKLIFSLYHPIAKFRFKYKFFDLPVESYLRNFFFN